jgi:integrase
MAKVTLLIRVQDEGKQIRVQPILRGRTPKKTAEGFWARVGGQERVFKDASYVLRYRDSQNEHRKYEVIGNDPVLALDQFRKKQRELDAKNAVQEAGLKLVEPQKNDRRTLADAITAYLENQEAVGKAHKTVIGRKHKLQLFREHCQRTYLADITVADLERFITFLRGKYKSPKGRRTIFNVFGAVSTFLRSNGITLGCKLVSELSRQYIPKDVVAYTPEELKALFTICSEEDKLVFEFFLYSGFREGEVANLRWNNINFHMNTVRIAPKPNWNPKRKSDRRVIPLPAWLVDKLKFRFEATKAKLTDLVFPNGQGGVDGHLLRRLQAIAKELPGHYELHKFRKTFAGLYVHRVDIETLRQMLGHTSLDITQSYIQCFMAEKPEAQAIANSLPVYGTAAVAVRA